MTFVVLTKKKLMILFSCVLIGIITITVASETAGKAVYTATEPRQIPIYYVDAKEKVCAMSFDAAWGNEQTNTLLDILDRYEVKSTVFLVKQWVDNFPDDVKAIAEHGHDVGNHSSTHPHMAQLSSDEQQTEITDCNNAIEALTGTAPTLFRAPYGEYNDAIRQVVTLFPENVYLLEMDKYAEKRQSWEVTLGHGNAIGYLNYSYQVSSYVDWYIRHYPDEFAYVQFIGTDYEYYLGFRTRPE